jgi:hypothetical protein
MLRVTTTVTQRVLVTAAERMFSTTTLNPKGLASSLKEKEDALVAKEMDFRNRSWGDYTNASKPQFAYFTIPVVLLLSFTVAAWRSRNKYRTDVELLQIKVNESNRNIQHLQEDKDEALIALYNILHTSGLRDNLPKTVHQALNAVATQQPLLRTKNSDAIFY